MSNKETGIVVSDGMIHEDDFLGDFMRGAIRVYVEGKQSFVDFVTLLKTVGNISMGNYDPEELDQVYDEVYKGKGILYFTTPSVQFSSLLTIPSGTYTLHNMSDDNPNISEAWKDVVFFDSIIGRLKGMVSDGIKAERRKSQEHRKLFETLFKKDGGTAMSRRIGNFYDEKTGETHWLEPDTVKDYPLPPGRIAEFGQTGYRTVNYALSSNEAEKTIELVASVELSNGKVTESDPVGMDELQFAELLFNAYVNDQTFANLDEVKAFSESSLVSLAMNAYKDHGLILNGLELSGFGSIFYDKDRVATFDAIKVKSEPYSNAVEIELVNSVSQTTLIAEKNPSISFIASGYELRIPSFGFKEIQSGVVTQYTITTETTALNPTNETNPFNHVYDDTVTPESPYMQERIALLASAELEDDSFEDRFGEIFQF